MTKVDYAVTHYFVASEVGVHLAKNAQQDLLEEVRERVASDDPRVKRSGLVPLGASTGIGMILESEHPGPTGVQIFIDLRHALRNHSPSKEEVQAMLVKIHDTLAPIWKMSTEDNMRKQLKYRQVPRSTPRRVLY